jgi:hypothetical protein
MLSDYKMAFDILRNMKPELDPNHTVKEIEISWCCDEFESYIDVYSCEGDCWESSLAKEISVSDELQISNIEIAARCLWSITFYGFSPSERNAVIDSLGKIEERFPSRTTRIEKSIRALTSNTCTEYEIRGTKSFIREDLQYLFDTEKFYEYRYQSYSFNAEQRIEYLIDLISNYENEDFSDFTRIFLMFRTSSNFPLIREEMDRIQNYFNHRLPSSANIRYGYGNDETLGTEVSILLLGSY